MSQSPVSTVIDPGDEGGTENAARLYAVDAFNGAEKWELLGFFSPRSPGFQAGFSSDPVVGVVNGESTVFIGLPNGTLCAVDVASGAIKWSRTLGVPPSSPGVLGSYVTSNGVSVSYTAAVSGAAAAGLPCASAFAAAGAVRRSASAGHRGSPAIPAADPAHIFVNNMAFNSSINTGGGGIGGGGGRGTYEDSAALLPTGN